jgi:2-polyprenyl-3-methyl-5-hydroxy-6-metoxy-1,4-benzoquinol methylase
MLSYLMPLTDSEVKSAIRSRWDVSSQKYDTHDGHGIKSAEERDAWKRVLGEALARSGLDILDVGCGTGEMSLVLAEMGHNVQGSRSIRKNALQSEGEGQGLSPEG